MQERGMKLLNSMAVLPLVASVLTAWLQLLEGLHRSSCIDMLTLSILCLWHTSISISANGTWLGAPWD